MTPEQIVSEANERGVQLVRFLYCDNGGVIRGKSTHVGALARRMQSGIGLVKGMQSFTSLDFLAPDGTYGPVGEVRLIPDPDTFVILPYAPRSGQMVVNMVELDHQPWALDPRAFLQRMIAAASAKGFACNFLTSYADAPMMRGDLFYADPSEVLRHCLGRFGRHAAVLHDYPLYEFTIMVRL